ncbi:homocysteine S-methyltransferase family protein [Fulvimarina sp. MAC8]|uniref:homocysteine S-methyltransferase family protein n=1 Tax=Fulvimarina sp. MAC8 TaxID=3162874 RepID=UPI0032ED6DF6
MKRYEELMARISAGETILIDGGTGTEIEGRGVPQLPGAWNGGGTLSHPNIVRSIHEEYICHGAEIVIANTFAATHHALTDAGEAGRFADYNRRAIELAVEARDRMDAPGVAIAGGVSYWSWTYRHPPLERLERSVAVQTAIMRDAGADLLMLEMMVGVSRMQTTLRGARESGLPIWVGLSCDAAADGTMRLMGDRGLSLGEPDGEPLADALSILATENVPLVSIMHTDVRHIDACLDVTDKYWNGPVGVYAHAAVYHEGRWLYENAISTEDYANASERWVRRGVQIIGGCCGIRPDHIEVLRKRLMDGEA